jgi:ribonuclease HII
MGLLYSGIDEAGYGPMLGPLCVGRASLRVEGWEPIAEDGQAARVPDVWEVLSSVVAKTRKEAKGRITVADSKKLKLASSSVRNHPLVHLERGVLTMLGTIGDVPRTDLELFEMLGVRIEDQRWFGGDPIELPVGNEMDLLKIDSNGLRTAMHKSGVELDEIKVHAMGVGDFNEVVRAHGTKAATTAQLLLEHLRSVAGVDAEHTRVVIDRQSGRTHYHKLLSRVWDEIETLEESARASRYKTDDGVGVLLVSKADDGYFPVSLASMAAKYVRELMMARFNRYWCAKVPELKPTAGYVQDARRWLVDAEGVLMDGDRVGLVRIA